MTSCPHCIQGNITTFQFLWNNRIAQTHSGKSGVFRKALQLDRTCFGTLTLINRVRYIVLWNICFICCIVDDHSSIFVCIIYPHLKLVFCDGGAGRIVRQTEINNVWCLLWKFRHKIIFHRARHINDIAPCLCLCIIFACSSCHNIRVHIDRIYRIAHCYAVIHRKNFLNISGITLCSVWNKNLIRRDITSSCLIIIFRDRTS